MTFNVSAGFYYAVVGWASVSIRFGSQNDLWGLERGVGKGLRSLCLVQSLALDTSAEPNPHATSTLDMCPMKLRSKSCPFRCGVRGMGFV
jgi:hypothetical protein